MTAKFVSRNGETFRVLHKTRDTLWLIAFDTPTQRPFCVTAAEMEAFQRVPTPPEFVSDESDLSPAAEKRLAAIQPLLDLGSAAVTDRQLRLSVSKDIALRLHTTHKRVLRLYFRYLATGQISFSKKRERNVKDDYDWAIKTFYFSAKKFSLRASYDMMLVQRYAGPDGKLLENHPS